MDVPARVGSAPNEVIWRSSKAGSASRVAAEPSTIEANKRYLTSCTDLRGKGSGCRTAERPGRCAVRLKTLTGDA